MVYREEFEEGGQKVLKEYRFDYDHSRLTLWRQSGGGEKIKEWEVPLTGPVYDLLSLFYNVRLDALGPPLEEDLAHPGQVTFSPNGQILARIHVVRAHCWFALWDLKTRQHQPGPANDYMTSIAFSPDGYTLASGGHGITFYDMIHPLGSPPGAGEDEVQRVVFTPDGQTLVSGNADGSVRFYDGSLPAWIDRAGLVANRNLTQGEWKGYLGDKPYRRTFANLPEGEKDD